MRTLVSCLLVLLPVLLQAQVIAIRAGTIVDPRNGTTASGQTILIEGKRIKSIGANLAIPQGAQIIDLSREWLAPGLIDAHTHLTLTETATAGPFESFYLDQSTTFRAMRGLHNAQAVLRGGFTTVRDVGNSAEYAMSDVRRAIDKGWFVGPTIVDSGKIIAPFGGQSRDIPPEQGMFWRFEYIDANGVDEIRRAVRTNIYYGAGVIKLVSDNNRYHYSLEEVRAAVDEAHRAGVPVAIHVIFGGEAADNAIEAGVDSLEHGFSLSDSQLRRMVAKGVTLVSTDFPRAHLDVLGTSSGMLPEPSILAPQIIDRLRRAHRAGVRLVFGSDTVIDLPGKTRADMMLDYLDVWLEAGIAPMEILRAMTTDAAKLLRVDKERGALAEGLSADLIAMPGDPAKDIFNLRKIDFVMKEGQIVRGDGSRAGQP
jgi:imidazolonepropionase-like amidohydrolase